MNQSGPGARPRAPIRRLAAEYHGLRRRLFYALGALALVTVLGTAGFWVVGGSEYGLIDAVYMTIITLTTVGFTEVIDMSQNPAGRIFTVGLLVLGMGIVAYSVPMVAQYALEGHFNHMFTRRRMLKLIDRLVGHMVVCGDSETMWHVTEELVRTGRDTVLVVPTESLREDAMTRFEDVGVIVGDLASDQVLREAGLERASGAVVCMEDEKDTVIGVLTARQLAREIRVVAASEREETRSKLAAAGADAVVSPSHIGGLRMASELVRPKVVSFLDTMLRDGRNLRVEEIKVPLSAHSAEQTVGSLQLERQDGVLLLALLDPDSGDYTFKPAPGTPVKPGSVLIVMADVEGRRALERLIGAEDGR